MENLSKMNKLNYPNWLVPLDIAQELKAIGFDEPCTFAIDYTPLIEPFLVQHCNKGHNVVFCGEMKNLTYKTLDKNLLDKIAIIPTWEQVLEWFRDKGFMITLINYEDESKFSFYNMKIRGGVHYAEAFKTYEQAREELVYKLIEIYKSEQK